jgi:hypothetical protein
VHFMSLGVLLLGKHRIIRRSWKFQVSCIRKLFCLTCAYPVLVFFMPGAHTNFGFFFNFRGNRRLRLCGTVPKISRIWYKSDPRTRYQTYHFPKNQTEEKKKIIIQNPQSHCPYSQGISTSIQGTVIPNLGSLDRIRGVHSGKARSTN